MFLGSVENLELMEGSVNSEEALEGAWMGIWIVMNSFSSCSVESTDDAADETED